MARSLSELLHTISVDAPQGTPELQVFGLRWASDAGLCYATMDDALEEKTLDITEVSAAGQVPTLKVVNRADRMVFLMAGEQVIGAKQNRVLNASLMVAPRSESARAGQLRRGEPLACPFRLAQVFQRPDQLPRTAPQVDVGARHRGLPPRWLPVV